MTNLPSPDKKLSRRDFLKLAVTLTGSSVLASCAPTAVQNETAREKVSQTATAMVPKTAEQVLVENNAPPEVVNRTVSIKISHGEFTRHGSGFILETIPINKKNFALIATAGHTFTNENYEPIKITGIHITQPQINNLDLVPDPSIPIYTSNYVNNPHQDFGFFLIQVHSIFEFSPLETFPDNSISNSENLYGLGFPSTGSESTLTFEKIPYIIRPDQIQPQGSNEIILNQISSPGASGTVLINNRSQPKAIITDGKIGTLQAICSLFPPDYQTRRQSMIDQMTISSH